MCALTDGRASATRIKLHRGIARAFIFLSGSCPMAVYRRDLYGKISVLCKINNDIKMIVVFNFLWVTPEGIRLRNRLKFYEVYSVLISKPEWRIWCFRFKNRHGIPCNKGSRELSVSGDWTMEATGGRGELFSFTNQMWKTLDPE